MIHKIHISAPAKINLSLRIDDTELPHSLRNGTSLHKLEGVFLKIPLYDEIIVSKSPKKKIEIRYFGKFSKGIPNNSESIVFLAAKKFFQKIRFSEGISIAIEKNIPPSSGLGGASSDAAAVLKSLIELFSEQAQNIEQHHWREICLSLGSDVPFFFSPYTKANVSGHGEICEEISDDDFSGKFISIAMLPKILCNTKWAYGELDAYRSLHKNTAEVINDFELPIFAHFPDLKKLRDDFISLDAKMSALTGSGSAIFAVFTTKEKALQAKKVLEPLCSFWKTVEIKKMPPVLSH
ncbi:hypothetical protein HZA38_02505 [Candidatus Peregrinibacteria bacterium]|nr:hypothetical protein [Candidatus Peregrinibacteria bacterium]